MKTLGQIVDEVDELQKQINKLVSEALEPLKAALVNFLEHNPGIKEIAWQQYTPYFNDGDECIFRVQEPYFLLNGEDLGSVFDWYQPWRAKYEPSEEHPALTVAIFEGTKEFASLLGTLPEEMLKMAFGDHAEVHVTRAGVTVDEYEHD